MVKRALLSLKAVRFFFFDTTVVEHSSPEGSIGSIVSDTQNRMSTETGKQFRKKPRSCAQHSMADNVKSVAYQRLPDVAIPHTKTL